MFVLAGSSFPGLRDLIFDFDDLEGKDKLERVTEIKKHVSDLLIMFRQASHWLKDANV